MKFSTKRGVGYRRGGGSDFLLGLIGRLVDLNVAAKVGVKVDRRSPKRDEGEEGKG